RRRRHSPASRLCNEELSLYELADSGRPLSAQTKAGLLIAQSSPAFHSRLLTAITTLHFLRLRVAIESIMFFANCFPFGSDGAISVTTKLLCLNSIEMRGPRFNCDKYASCPTPCIFTPTPADAREIW